MPDVKLCPAILRKTMENIADFLGPIPTFGDIRDLNIEAHRRMVEGTSLPSHVHMDCEMPEDADWTERVDLNKIKLVLRVNGEDDVVLWKFQDDKPILVHEDVITYTL